MQILTNHIGYERLGPKKAVLMLDEDSLLPSSQVELIDVDNKQCVGHFPLGQIARVKNGIRDISVISTFPPIKYPATIICAFNTANPKHLLFQITSCANQHFPI